MDRSNFCDAFSGLESNPQKRYSSAFTGWLTLIRPDSEMRRLMKLIFDLLLVGRTTHPKSDFVV